MNVETTRARYLTNLDGLRTLAALAVFATHVSYCVVFPVDNWLSNLVNRYLLHNSRLGVRFFFVLSGFLITRLICHEKASDQGFSLKRFYLKRVLRIWPVYYLTILIGYVLAQSGSPLLQIDHVHWPLLLAFCENFDQILTSRAGLDRSAVVGVLWSVSVEEQFYLFFPLLLMSTGWRTSMFVSALFVLNSIAFRLYYGPFGTEGLLHTLSVAADLGIGAMLALLLWGRPRLGDRLAALPGWLSLGCYAFLPFSLWLQHLYPKWGELQIAVSLLQSFDFALIVFDQAFRPQTPLNLSKVPLLNRMGKYTYGFYCYHLACALFLQLLWPSSRDTSTVSLVRFIAFFCLALGLTQTVSYLSYRFFEQPFLKLKDRLSEAQSA